MKYNRMEIKNKSVHFLLTGFFILALIACSSEITIEETHVFENNLSDNPLSFDVSVNECPTGITRGADVTLDNLTSFGLIGIKQETAGDRSVPPSQYIDNGEVTRQATINWSTEYSWPVSDLISIYAYGPYNASGINYGIDASTKRPFLSYTMPELAQNQKDLIVDYKEDVIRNGKNPIPLNFDHICAKVIIGLGDSYKNTIISKISLIGIDTAADYFYDEEEWKNHRSTGTVYQTFSYATEDVKNTVLTSGELQFMVIPQKLTGAAELYVEYSDGTDSSSKLLLPFTDEWKAGETYRYDLNMFTWDFSYTGAYEKFTVEKDGLYMIEVWGAQGVDGSVRADNIYGYGGKGGYAWGYKELTAGDVFYICVGGQPSNRDAGGFNGGGNAGNQNGQSGSGCTHIATTLRGSGTTQGCLTNYSSTYTSEVLLVGGGGGGCDGARLAASGAGGGTSGGVGKNGSGGSYTIGAAGTQTKGGGSGSNAGSFGKGGNATNSTGNASNGKKDYGAGGGGGLYGGAGTLGSGSGGGGSGYTNPNLLISGKYGMTTGKRYGHGKARFTLVKSK